MTFIITFLALFIERFFHWSHLRNWQWFNLYQRKLNTLSLANKSSFLLLMLCVLPWVAIVGIIHYYLGCCFYGILQLIFGTAVLLYCMGPRNLWVQTFACLHDLHDQDPKVAVDRVQRDFGIALPQDSQAFHQAFTKAIFIESNQRIFAAVFWFVLLGPMGAILYRCVAFCAEQSNLGIVQTAAIFQRILDWIPVRLLSFFFALGGHFIRVFHHWKLHALKGSIANDDLLTECGLAALDIKDTSFLPENGTAEKSALDLFDRSLVIGLVVLAMVVLLIVK